MSYTGTNTIHATFNWNPAYDSYKHVALWGNDITGDGTKKYPYRTLNKVITLGANQSAVISSMVVRELNTSTSPQSWFADGNVIIDVSAGPFMTQNYNATGIYFRGGGNSPVTTGPGTDIVTGCTYDGAYNIGGFSFNASGCTFKNVAATHGANFTICINNTFYALTNFSLTSNIIHTKCIFKDCKINIFVSAGTGFTYCNFHNCSIKFGTTGSYVTYTDFATFKADFVAAGGDGSKVFNVYFTDPLFNNPSIGDLTLAINSPAKNMAYDGTLIGSQSIGLSLVGSTTAAASAFDNSSAVNLTIDGTTGALTMTNTSINSQITAKPIANLQGRNIASLSVFGFYSDRNGEYIDATPDLDLTGLYAAGDTLTADRIYMVDGSGGQLTYNGTNYAVGDRLVCRSAATTFSNVSVAAYLREIIEGPTRNTVEARFSNGTGTMKNNGDILTAGYWYYLSAGTAALSGLSYTAGQFMKGDGTAVSSAGATIEEVFTTDSYQYYDSFGPLTCNRSGNVFTGAITKGNGDPNFDRTSANVFKIAAKYIQIRFTIQANNLTP